MDQTTYNIAKELIDFTYWGDTPKEQIPIWELRDILSHLDRDFNLSADEDRLVNDIVDNISNNFSWQHDQLTIAGEAKVQQLLSFQGRNMRCFGLNDFPNSTQELNKYLDPYSFTKKWTAKLDYTINQLKPKIKKLEKYANSYMFKYTLVTAAALIYGMLVAPHLILWAFLASYIMCNCITITVHEYWVHDLLTPRNRLIGFIMDYLGHILYDTSRLEWRYRHTFHHIHWKTDNDPDKIYKLTPTWVYFLFGISYSDDNPETNLMDEYERNWPTYRVNNLKKLLPESAFLEKYATQIKYASHLLVILLVGVTNWIFFFLLQIWLFQHYILGFNELVTHHNDLTREQEADHPELFLVCCGTAYHNTHHYNRNMVVLGPGWIKYCNMQYYFIKLFYRLRSDAHLS